MIGVLELTEGRGRRPWVERRRLLGLNCLWAAVPVREGVREKALLRRVRRGAEALARAGVRRVLTASQFPHWAVLRQAGLYPVAPENFCQAMAAPLALAALAAQERPPEQARVLLTGRRAGPAMYRAAERLCPRVRALAVDAGEEGERLAAWLRLEYGVAVQPPRPGETDVVLCFGPDGAGGSTVFRLYGERPDLAGFRPVPAAGELPPGLDPLPLAALLWEEGRLSEKQLYFLPPNPKLLT